MLTSSPNVVGSPRIYLAPALIILTFLLHLSLPSSSLAGDCIKHVILHGDDHYRDTLGLSEGEVKGHRIHLYRTEALHRIVGRISPGARLPFIEKERGAYEVVAHNDQGGNSGWIGRDDVEDIRREDTETHEACKRYILPGEIDKRHPGGKRQPKLRRLK